MSFVELPTEIKAEILFIVGNNNFSTFQQCMLVCKSWKDIITWCLKDRPSKRWGHFTANMIRKSWNLNYPLGS